MLSGFRMITKLKPKGDQAQAIEKLCNGLVNGRTYQTLLGITGSGKTFTMAKVIEKFQRPTIVISHNKTLAAQLFQEFRDFFPHNSVNYFVSYYDYYQPEAYIPETDTYIEKDAKINDELDKLRHAATSALSERTDVIVVASVSCIYGIGEPEDYRNMAFSVKKGTKLNIKELVAVLVDLQYQRNDYELDRGTFRRREEMLEVGLIDENAILRVYFKRGQVVKICKISHKYDSGEIITHFSKFLASPEKKVEDYDVIKFYPAKHFTTPKDRLMLAIHNIKLELKDRLAYFKKHNKEVEAQRLFHRTNEDLHFLKQTGYCKGIENYERHLYFRKAGAPPSTLFNYFPNKFLTIIDESHMTIPQLHAMQRGDLARKKTLVDYGFRLPSAYDHRPLKFSELTDILEKRSQVIFVSATPSNYEIHKSIGDINLYEERLRVLEKIKPDEPIEKFYLNLNGLAEQIIRPTGLLDPEIEVRMNVKEPMKNVIKEITKEIKQSGRVLVLTITKRLAEAISEVLQDKGFKTNYLHSEIKTLERPKILNDLRQGNYDVIVGINLLREGLDLPEVSLILILEGDKEGFLRNKRSLIQMVGRAARHPRGRAVIYANTMTNSILATVFETKRRRTIQEKHNKLHKIIPRAVLKEIRAPILQTSKYEKDKKESDVFEFTYKLKGRNQIIKQLTQEMYKAAKNMDFEQAAYLRDKIKRLQENDIK